MAQRFDASKISSALYKKYIEFSFAFKDSPIKQKTRDLINIRVSQMNGCAFCLDMHVKEAKLHGEGELRLHHIAIWHELPLFTPYERAALEWAETMTKLNGRYIEDSIYNKVREQLSEQEVSDLTMAIVAINGWNRISIASGNVPGSYDAVYGLDKVVFADAA